MEKEKKKPFISEKLSNLIYNPELPSNWKTLPGYQKLQMFHYLFLTLNKDFQRIMGEEFEAYIEIEKARESGTERHENHWFLYEKNNYLIYKGCNKCDHKDNLLLCRGPFRFRELYDLLQRRDVPLIAYGILDEDDLKEIRTLQELPLAVEGFKPGEIVAEDYDIENHRKYIRKRKKGIMPHVIYPAIPLSYRREKVLRHFVKFIDTMQKTFFEQHPETKSWAYEKLKSDGRKVSYPFDEWERYYKVYVLRERDNLKQTELAKVFFPKDVPGSGEAKISKDIKKANRLIKNSWVGDFPGNYL